MNAIPREVLHGPTATGSSYAFDQFASGDVISTNQFQRFVLFRQTDTAEVTALKFGRLARQWKEQTSFMSSVEDICTNDAYQEIIRMGTQVVPYILRDLEENHAYWLWALTAITGATPVPIAYQGTYDEAVQAWLDWASQNGYEW